MQSLMVGAKEPSYRSTTPSAAARRQYGQGMVEYAMILVIVSIVAIFLMVSMGSQLTGMFSNVTHALGT